MSLLQVDSETSDVVSTTGPHIHTYNATTQLYDYDRMSS